MTMVPAQNHLSSDQQLYGGYVGGCGGAGRFRESSGCGDHLMNGGQVCEYSTTTLTENSCLGSDLLLPHMAEDESRTNSLNEEAGSSRDEDWLQLSIGGHSAARASAGKHDQQRDSGARRSPGLVELDLLPTAAGRNTCSDIERCPIGETDFSHCNTPKYEIRSSSRRSDPIFQAPQIPTSSRFITNLTNLNYNLGDVAGTSQLFFPHLGSSGSSNFLQQEINLAFRPVPPYNVAATHPVPSSSPLMSSASSSFLPLMGRVSSYFGRPLIHFQGSGVDVAGPSSELRIISPPRRPHSGIWFTLKALENQAKEPFLPQIPKNYLRIKDGKMTVRLVMKYLVNKLSLDSESEIEMRCRGQHLLPFLTLQHVRDTIWTSSSSSTRLFHLLHDSSSTDHLMVLHYGRII